MELTAAEIEKALEGKQLPRRPFQPLYFLALLLTAIAVVAIVVAYFGAVGALVFGMVNYASTWFAAVGDAADPEARRVAIIMLALILFLPTALVVIMLKPFVAPRAPGAEFRFKIEPGRHPAFDALVNGIARKMGMRPPTQVIVTNEVNASASLGEGIGSVFGNRLELMVGLPLASTMSVAQLGGIIAHEYGHFSQRIGMRLSHLISAVTNWLYRTAYTYDKWDIWLAIRAEAEEGVSIERVVLWISNIYRFVLKCVAWLAGAVTCLTRRQMEYHADVPNIDFSGSEDFATTSIRLAEVNCAFQVALSNCEAFWVDRRLPENFPAFVASTLGEFSKRSLDEIKQNALKAESSFFHSHPSDRSRIEKAKRRNARGILHLNVAATSLFKEFDKLAKHVTHNYYDIDLGLEVHRENLVENSQFEREKEQRISDQKLSDGYYGKGASVFIPVGFDPAQFALGATTAELWEEFDELKARLPEAIDAQVKQTGRFFKKHVERAVTLRQALVYAQAGIPINRSSFDITNTSPVAIEGDRALADKEAQEELARMSDVRVVYSELFRVALNLLNRDDVCPLDLPGLREKFEEAWAMCQVLWCCRRGEQALRELRYQGEACHYVLEFVFTRDESDPETTHLLPATARSVAQRLEKCRARATGFFQGFPYPFEHADAGMTIPKHLHLSEEPPQGYNAEDPFHRAQMEMHRARYCLDQVTTLYFRVLERMASFCEALEDMKPTDRPTVTAKPGEVALAS